MSRPADAPSPPTPKPAKNRRFTTYLQPAVAEWMEEFMRDSGYSESSAVRHKLVKMMMQELREERAMIDAMGAAGKRAG